MLPLLMSFFFIGNCNTNEVIRRTNYYTPYIIGIISWKDPKKFVKFAVCTGSVFKHGWFMTAHFCIDIYKLGDTVEGRVPHNYTGEGEYIYRIGVTMMHPQLQKRRRYTIVRVKINNCLGLGQFSTDVLKLSYVPPLNKNIVVQLIQNGTDTRTTKYGYLVKLWNRPIVGWQYHEEVLFDLVKYQACNYEDHKVTYSHFSVCVTGESIWLHEPNPAYWFEYYGAVIISSNDIVGIVYEKPVKNQLTACSIITNLGWIEYITNVPDANLYVNFNLDLTIDDSE